MGTRYEDQPPEHWAGPESLDPTPVWKQFMLIGLLALAGLGLIGGFAYFALATQLATPPALVAGGRVVLARAQVPAVGAPGVKISAPIIDEAHAFWLVQPLRGEIVAVRSQWSPDDATPACPVSVAKVAAAGFAAGCGAFEFGPRGEPLHAPRALDRYLVSLDGDRIVVNISRVIAGYGQTPQPTLAPLK